MLGESAHFHSAAPKHGIVGPKRERSALPPRRRDEKFRYRVRQKRFPGAPPSWQRKNREENVRIILTDSSLRNWISSASPATTTTLADRHLLENKLAKSDPVLDRPVLSCASATRVERNDRRRGHFEEIAHRSSILIRRKKLCRKSPKSNPAARAVGQDAVRRVRAINFRMGRRRIYPRHIAGNWLRKSGPDRRGS